MSQRPARGKIGDLNSPHHPFVSEGICRIDADVAACWWNQPVPIVYDFTRTLTRHQNAEHHWWATLTLLSTFLLAAFLVYQFWNDYEEKSKSTGRPGEAHECVCRSARTPTRLHAHMCCLRLNMYGTFSRIIPPLPSFHLCVVSQWWRRVSDQGIKKRPTGRIAARSERFKQLAKGGKAL